MSITATFALDGYKDDCSSIPNCIAQWDARHPRGAGRFYVYAYRAEGSIFYIGKGTGQRAWERKGHAHPRFHVYVTAMLSEPYTVEVLRSLLAEDDAEELEQTLITCFQRQLVNWNAGAGHVDTWPDHREQAAIVFEQGRAAEKQRSWTLATNLYREFLAEVSRAEDDHDGHVLRTLQERASSELPCRVDLYERVHLHRPHAPVVACEALSRLTRCLCELSAPGEAQLEIEAFTRRYPHGSFAPYDVYIPATRAMGTVPVTQREQATLTRVEKALRKMRTGRFGAAS